MLDNPCGKSCPRRDVGCAVSCEAWQAYVKARDAGYAARNEAKNYEYDAKRLAIAREEKRSRKWRRRSK